MKELRIHQLPRSTILVEPSLPDLALHPGFHRAHRFIHCRPCDILNHLIAVLAFFAETVMYPLTWSTSDQSRRIVSAVRRPAKAWMASTGSKSQGAADNGPKSCSGVRISGRFIDQLDFVNRPNRIGFDQPPFDAMRKKGMDHRAIVDNALWTK
jgi:hypothetical protein